MKPRAENYITVGAGEKVEVLNAHCSLDSLEYYTENPRILSITTAHKGKITQKFIGQELWKKDYTKQLYKQIEKDGGLVEPLLVYKNTVLEGNTRLCCLRHLAEKSKEKWSDAPCRIISEKISQKQIDFLLCTYHIKRKKDWDPYEQACYFRKMKEEDKLHMDKICELTGLSAPTIYQYLKTLKKMKEHHETDPKRFSFWLEYLKNPTIQEVARKDPKLEQKFHHAVNEGSIPRAIDVRMLKTVLKDKKATRQLFTNKIDVYEAERNVKEARPEVGDSFLGAISDLTEEINELEMGKIREIKADSRKLKVIKKFATSVKRFLKALSI